jgi:hypothetical protein
MLPPGHLDTLKVMFNLARSYVALNRHAEAIPLIDALLDKAQERGVPPPLSAVVANWRLRHYQKVGDPAECRATAAGGSNQGCARQEMTAFPSKGRFAILVGGGIHLR